MDPLKTLLESAFASAREGAYKAALDEFKIILSHNPNHAGALFGAAGCHYRMSSPEASLEFLERLLKINPSHPEGLKLLREIRMGGVAPQGASAIEEAILMEVGFVDPFGTGLDKQNREIEIIPEWRSPGRDVPGIGETFREGKTSCLSGFRIGKVYRESWRQCRGNFKKLYLASLISLLIWGGVLIPFFLGVFQSYQDGVVFVFGCLVAFVLLYPLTGLLSCFFYLIRNDKNLTLGHFIQFANFYPIIAFSLVWLVLPVPFVLCFLYGVTFFAEVLFNFPVSAWLYSHLGEIALGLFGYLWLRCWFLHQSAYSHPEDHPLTVLGRAYYATSGQQIRLFLFIVLQSVLFTLGTVALGLGIPLVHAAQTEAFLQTQATAELTKEKLGFIPKPKRNH